MALTTFGVDVGSVIQAQRTATLRTLREHTRPKAQADAAADAAWLLVNESMIFQVEAEARWLDHCEAQPTSAPPGAAPPLSQPVTANNPTEVAR